MTTTSLLDLTGLSEMQQQESLLATLDGLPIGAAMTIQTGADWNGLLLFLQGVRWGQFDWFPLEAGPEVWHADLVHLSPNPRNSTLGGFLPRDHHRCDSLYAHTENAANEENAADMRRFCRQFCFSMLHHFRMEEEAFFPAFEERTGMRQGPTTVMRMEHEQMRNLMNQMAQAAEKGDSDLLLKSGGTLMFVMQQHNVKEEQMLYPMADTHLRADVEPLLKEMQLL